MQRPYRFGIFFGVVNVLAGLYYGWLAVVSGEIGGVIMLGFSSLLSIAAGVGLLMKRRFGISALNLTFFLATVAAITDWFKPHAMGLVYYVLWNVAFFALIFAIGRYFYKRWDEFSVRTKPATVLPSQAPFPKMTPEQKQRTIEALKQFQKAKPPE